MAFALLSQLFQGRSQSNLYSNYPAYEGKDLGLTYSPNQSGFKIWSPPAEKCQLLLYEKGEGGEPLETIEMAKHAQGIWLAHLQGDHKNQFYTFRVMINGKWMAEVPDPYAKAAGVNGKRAAIIELNDTDPSGWASDHSPDFKNPADAIIYELHVRDASIALNSGIRNKGKFLGLTEKGTVNQQGLSTGLDHLKELGVTHIHLLPFFDFNSVDESMPAKPQYNWGYDPLNYNIPEGSYATNAGDPYSRIKELKEMIKAFHETGLRVIMDVVYNHTALTETSNFNQLVPGYYYRQNKDGGFSNATACGNETASERPMMRKFIRESMEYWVKEYHVDGFRVDLMGVHDIETMNVLSKSLHTIKPDILIYGEGWTAGASPLPDSVRALKKFAYKLKKIAVFSDDVRDGIKGSVFDHPDRGFASGKAGMEESIRFGVVASCKHPQVNYKLVNYSKSPYAAEPSQTITYCECHDNHTLWDKLAISATTATVKERKEMHKLALSIVLTSQGISFLHAGTEFLRSKQGVENSFQSPDSINAIDWNLKTNNKDVFEYVRQLIQMRKDHPAFRMRSNKDIATNLRFLERSKAGIVAYVINGTNVKDGWKRILVIFNGNEAEQSFNLPTNEHWKFQIQDNKFLEKGQELPKAQLKLAPFSCTLLYAK